MSDECWRKVGGGDDTSDDKEFSSSSNSTSVKTRDGDSERDAAKKRGEEWRTVTSQRDSHSSREWNKSRAVDSRGKPGMDTSRRVYTNSISGMTLNSEFCFVIWVVFTF